MQLSVTGDASPREGHCIVRVAIASLTVSAGQIGCLTSRLRYFDCELDMKGSILQRFLQHLLHLLALLHAYQPEDRMSEGVANGDWELRAVLACLIFVNVRVMADFFFCMAFGQEDCGPTDPRRGGFDYAEPVRFGCYCILRAIVDISGYRR